MKTIIFTIFAFIFFAHISSAQDGETDHREKFIFGVKVGANLSNVYDSEGEEFEADPKLGFATGAFLSIPIGKFIGIQPEVLFSQKGFRATGVIGGNPYSFTRTTNYIDVPLLFAIKPNGLLTILVGPQYSYLLMQHDEFKTSSFSSQQKEEFENDNIRKNTLCVTGGLDVNINHFVLSGRVGWDIQNNKGDGTSYTPRYKNVWYQATVGYRFL